MSFSYKNDFWLVLNKLFHRGNGEYLKVKKLFDNSSSLEEFKKLITPLIDEKCKLKNIDIKKWLKEEKIEIEKNSVELVSIVDDDYSENLKEINDPPFLLYCIGKKLLLKSNQKISIVGARKCNSYGADICEKFSSKLAEKGVTIVSGLALGIDKIAHKSALTVKGNTIAVLGSGINMPYPRTNLKLYDEICEKGLIISEFPMNMGGRRENFPIRNRIVAGLSKFTLIIQASLKSGTLITARLANEYGREVFALPGDIRLKLSEGVNKLILDGAIPALNVEQILFYMGVSGKSVKHIDIFENHGKLTAQEKKIIDLIKVSPMTINELAQKSKIKVSIVNALVIGLEVDGLVKQESGRRVVLVV